MVKIISVVLILLVSVYGDIFEQNCLKCHNSQELNIFMKKYTLRYSSETKIKKALFNFLDHPTSSVPLMPYSFIIKNGYKQKLNLTQSKLKEAINIYYKNYNLKQYIK
jgi:hypothetical protein